MDMDIVYRNGRMVEGKNERWGFVGKPLTTVVTDSGLIWLAVWIDVWLNVVSFVMRVFIYLPHIAVPMDKKLLCECKANY